MCMQKRTSEVAVNVTYKDSLFRMLFRDKDNLLSLYNAINQTSYDDPEALTVVTLENAIYMGMKNDQAFLLDSGLNLYEHQSTWNPNMPLRDLFYVSMEYQRLITKRSLYSKNVVKIPAPNFIVFYNGTEAAEERVELRLSDSFETVVERPNLELIVTQLNINPGYNEPLMEACQILREYMQYVDRVRRYARTMELKQAVERAVRECIREGILADFLIRNRAEVIMISILEYDAEKERRLLREEEYAEGKRDGRKEGRREGIALTKQVLRLSKEGKSPEEIAETLSISEQEVKEILEE